VLSGVGLAALGAFVGAGGAAGAGWFCWLQPLKSAMAASEIKLITVLFIIYSKWYFASSSVICNHFLIEIGIARNKIHEKIGVTGA